jgi:hypothetical protein
MDWLIWECLSPEKQKELIKAGWKAVKEKARVKVIPLTSEVEDTEEISKLMRQMPKQTGEARR